jgi:hypothetical protein
VVGFCELGNEFEFSVFRCAVDEICTRVGYYAALSVVLDLLTLEDGTDRLSRNVGAEIPLNAA